MGSITKPSRGGVRRSTPTFADGELVNPILLSKEWRSENPISNPESILRPTTKIGRRKRVSLFIIWLLLFCDYILMTLAISIFPLLEVSDLHLGILFAAKAFFQLVASPFTQYVLDYGRVYPKWIIPIVENLTPMVQFIGQGCPSDFAYRELPNYVSDEHTEERGPSDETQFHRQSNQNRQSHQNRQSKFQNHQSLNAKPVVDQRIEYRRTMILTGLGLEVFSLLLFAFTFEYYTWLFGRAISGVASAMICNSAMAHLGTVFSSTNVEPPCGEGGFRKGSLASRSSTGGTSSSPINSTIPTTPSSCNTGFDSPRDLISFMDNTTTASIGDGIAAPARDATPHPSGSTPMHFSFQNPAEKAGPHAGQNRLRLPDPYEEYLLRIGSPDHIYSPGRDSGVSSISSADYKVRYDSHKPEAMAIAVTGIVSGVCIGPIYGGFLYDIHPYLPFFILAIVEGLLYIMCTREFDGNLKSSLSSSLLHNVNDLERSLLENAPEEVVFQNGTSPANTTEARSASDRSPDRYGSDRTGKNSPRVAGLTTQSMSDCSSIPQLKHSKSSKGMILKASDRGSVASSSSKDVTVSELLQDKSVVSVLLCSVLSNLAIGCVESTSGCIASTQAHTISNALWDYLAYSQKELSKCKRWRMIRKKWRELTTRPFSWRNSIPTAWWRNEVGRLQVVIQRPNDFGSTEPSWNRTNSIPRKREVSSSPPNYEDSSPTSNGGIPTSYGYGPTSNHGGVVLLGTSTFTENNGAIGLNTFKNDLGVQGNSNLFRKETHDLDQELLLYQVLPGDISFGKLQSPPKLKLIYTGFVALVIQGFFTCLGPKDNVYMQAISLVGLGFGMGFLDGTTPAVLGLIAELDYCNTGKVFLLMNTATQIGFVIGPILGNVLTGQYGLTCFYIGFCLMFYPFLNALFL